MQNVMIDLETLGTTPGSVILSIGAVFFDPYRRELGEEFYVIIDVDSSEKAGLFTDTATLHWWSEQSEEARRILREASSEGSSPLPEALAWFTNYLFRNVPDPKDRLVWGCGSDFDNVLLAMAFEAAKLPLPWKYAGNRCYRTLKALAPEIRLEREGLHHHALYDAIHQAKHAMMIHNQLLGNKRYHG